MVNTKGLSKAVVLAALYNNAAPMGMGWLISMMGGRQPMRGVTEEEAAEWLAIQKDLRFDYIQGRPIKVDLSNDDGFEEWLYDRDYGRGAAQRAIDSIRKV